MASKRFRNGIAAAVLAAVTLAPVMGKDVYVIDGRGKKHEGIELSVKSTQGDLELNVDGRIRVPFRAGSYTAAFVPKPPEIDALEKALQAGQHEAVIKAADSAFEKFKFIGWGDRAAYLQGMSLVQTGKPDEALKAFAKGRQFRGGAAEDLNRGIILALLEQKDVERVQPLLAGMITSSRTEDAAFALNARGRLLNDAGKSKEAVLEYLKVLLFFPDTGALQALRQEARTAAVEIMKKMNDGRWKRIESIK